MTYRNESALLHTLQAEVIRLGGEVRNLKARHKAMAANQPIIPDGSPLVGPITGTMGYLEEAGRKPWRCQHGERCCGKVMAGCTGPRDA